MAELEDASPEDLIRMVKDLRNENADWRTKHREYEQVFSQFDDATARGLLSLVNNLGQDEKGAAVVLRDLAYDILGDEILKDAPWASEETPEEEETEDVTNEEQTKLLEKLEAMEAELAAIKEEREQTQSERKAAEDAEVQKVVDEAVALGYEVGTEDFVLLMRMASKRPDGDLREAAKKLSSVTGIEVKDEGDDQAEDTDEEEGDDEDGKRFPSTSKANAGAPGPEKAEAPKSWAEARSAVEAMLDSQS